MIEFTLTVSGRTNPEWPNKVISKVLNMLYNVNPNLRQQLTIFALVIIILVGSTTIAVTEFVLDASADTGSHLYVSAERTGNHVDGLQIVEVVVLNNSLLPLHMTPDVTINGNPIVMTETVTGNYYAYFASYPDVQAVRDANAANPDSNPGLDFGSQCNYLNDQAAGALCDVNGVIKSSKPATAPESTWPFIQLYDFPDDTIDVQYNRLHGGTETATLIFGTADTVGISLDRDAYPAGAEIHAVITDHRLNIDPTSADAWTWDVTGTSMYYGLNDIELNQIGSFSNSDVSDKRVDPALVCDVCSLKVDFNTQDTQMDIVKTTSAGDRPTNPVHKGSDYQTERWLSVSEVDGHNTGIFATTDENHDSALQVASDAIHGMSATITYDDVHTIDIPVRHVAPIITIDPPMNQWIPGLPVHVTVVDQNANKNSRLDERLSVADVDSIIPTVTTGDPFTLSHSNNTTWIGYNLLLSNDEATRLQNTKVDPTTHDDTKLNLNGNPADPFSYRVTETRAYLGFKNVAVVEPSTDRLFLVFHDEFDSLIQTSLDALNLTPDSPFLTGFSVLVMDQDYSDLKDFLIDDRADDQSGFNMLYYDFSSMGGDDVSVNRVQINVDRKRIAVVDTDGPSGFVMLPDAFVSAIHDSTITGRLQLISHVSGMDVNAYTPYPAVVDFSSFGFKHGSDDSSGTDPEIVANQIVRLELEESTDSQGTFEGTLDYVIVNQLDIGNDDYVRAAVMPSAANNAKIVIVEDMDGNTSMSADYPQIDIDLSNTLAVESDTSSLSAAEPITTLNLRVTDSHYNILDSVTSGDLVYLSADLSNVQSTDRSFVYQIQIQDSDGAVVAIPRLSGFLPGNQSFSPLIPWILPGPGTYTATTFVWESLDNLTVLSPSVSIDISVN